MSQLLNINIIFSGVTAAFAFDFLISIWLEVFLGNMARTCFYISSTEMPPLYAPATSGGGSSDGNGFIM